MNVMQNEKCLTRTTFIVSNKNNIPGPPQYLCTLNAY